MNRRFARMRRGGLARDGRPSGPTLATTWAEAAILARLQELHHEFATREVTEPTFRTYDLLEVAFGRSLDHRLLEAEPPSVWSAAEDVYRWFCHCDDQPRPCGVADDRFAFYWSIEEPQPCPLVGLCQTQVAASAPAPEEGCAHG